MRSSHVGTAPPPSLLLPSDRLDFTSTLRSAGPRRRRAVAGVNALVSIFEDTPTDSAKQSVAKSRQLEEFVKPPIEQDHNVMLKKSRASLASNTRAKEMARDDKVVLKKEPRRRTIWVPSDDTTVLTIHPGSHDDQTNNLTIFPSSRPREEAQSAVSDVDAQPAQPRRTGRRKSLAQAPRRGLPLQPTLRPVQEAETVADRAGEATGKENIPPGQVEMAGSSDSKKAKASQIVMKRRASMLSPLAMNSASTVNIGSRKRDLNSPKEQPVDRKPRRPSMIPPYTQSRRLSTAARPEPRHTSASPTVVPVPKIHRLRTSVPNTLKYPLIYENVERPCMFEESWLSIQETAITELINRVFSNASSKSSKPGPKVLRQRLLDLYQGRDNLLLYQRLQASLQFGALSLPKEREAGPDALRFMNDVGLRKQFRRLWMKTYDEKALRAAAEVVVGRQVTAEVDRICYSSDLEDFICSCLLRNEDLILPAQHQANSKSPSWRWRRTMQRSLMLIKLLDHAKESGLLQRNLFKSSSTHKSSASVLGEFASILLPWGGEIVRALSHLDYQLHHAQELLSEYDYTVTNLAVDLRDGVRLTRLVELLLYPTGYQRQDSGDQTTSMPTGEVLDTSQQGNVLGPLSRHLKFPCTGHAVKAYNNQIALSALLYVRSTAGVAAKTTSVDIVDGHRENTLALLWALVNHWGLNSLIDWPDVRSELLRIAPGSVHETLLNKDLSSPSQRTQNRLLKDWANAIASKHSISMHNMTTAFADGRIFERIVDEYQPFLDRSSSEQVPTGLEAKLKSLGCSAAFSSIFGRTARGSLFDEKFTTAALAFLCSRLMVPSRAMREKRIASKRLAEDCATVVRTRERVLNAAVTLQRAWREHFAWKLEGFEREGVDLWLTV